MDRIFLNFVNHHLKFHFIFTITLGGLSSKFYYYCLPVSKQEQKYLVDQSHTGWQLQKMH